MAEEIETLEREDMDSLQFREIGKRTLAPRHSKDDFLNARWLCNSNTFGFTVIGRPDSIQYVKTAAIFDAIKNNKDLNATAITTTLVDYVNTYAKLSKLALSFDHLSLAAVLGNQVLLFDIAEISRKDSKPRKVIPIGNQDTYVTEICWNPKENKLLIVTSEKKLLCVTVNQNYETDIQSISTGAEITAACWSGSGNQIVIGLSDGSIQFQDAKLGSKQPITSRPEEDVREVHYLCWLANNEFVAAYKHSEEEMPLPMYFFQYDNGKWSKTKYSLFNQCVDPKSDATFHLSYLSVFKVLMVSSSTSPELDLLGRSNEGKWIVFSLEDAFRAQLPMAVGDEETVPRGLIFDMTSTTPVSTSASQDAAATAAAFPFPRLLVLNNEGCMLAYHLVKTDATSAPFTAAVKEVPAPSQTGTTASKTATLPTTPSFEILPATKSSTAATTAPTGSAFSFSGAPSSFAFTPVSDKPFGFQGAPDKKSEKPPVTAPATKDTKPPPTVVAPPTTGSTFAFEIPKNDQKPAFGGPFPAPTDFKSQIPALSATGTTPIIPAKKDEKPITPTTFTSLPSFSMQPTTAPTQTTTAPVLPGTLPRKELFKQDSQVTNKMPQIISFAVDPTAKPVDVTSKMPQIVSYPVDTTTKPETPRADAQKKATQAAIPTVGESIASAIMSSPKPPPKIMDGQDLMSQFEHHVLAFDKQMQNLSQLSFKTFNLVQAVRTVDVNAPHFTVANLTRVQERTNRASAQLALLNNSIADSKKKCEKLVKNTCEAGEQIYFAQRLMSDEKDPDYQKLLDSRKLDSDSTYLQKQIRQRITSVESKIGELEDHIYELWDFHQQNESIQKSILKSKGPTMDVIYRTIKDQYEVSYKQTQILDNLSSRIVNLKTRKSGTEPQKSFLFSPASPLVTMSVPDSPAHRNRVTEITGNAPPQSVASMKKLEMLRNSVTKKAKSPAVVQSPYSKPPIPKLSDSSTTARHLNFEEGAPASPKRKQTSLHEDRVNRSLFAPPSPKIKAPIYDDAEDEEDEEENREEEEDLEKIILHSKQEKSKEEVASVPKKETTVVIDKPVTFTANQPPPKVEPKPISSTAAPTPSTAGTFSFSLPGLPATTPSTTAAPTSTTAASINTGNNATAQSSGVTTSSTPFGAVKSEKAKTFDDTKPKPTTTAPTGTFGTSSSTANAGFSFGATTTTSDKKDTVTPATVDTSKPGVPSFGFGAPTSTATPSTSSTASATTATATPTTTSATTSTTTAPTTFSFAPTKSSTAAPAVSTIGSTTAPGTTSVFGPANTSAFGATSTTPSSFTTPPSTPDKPSTGPSFGFSTPQSSTTSSATSAFGNTPPTATSTPSATPSNISFSGFGLGSSVGVASSRNPFAAPSSTAAPTPGTTTTTPATTGGSVFGATTTAPSQSAFGTGATPAFGSTTPLTTAPTGTTQSVFGTPSSTSAFGTPATTSAFGSTTPLTSTTQSAFGATTATPAFGATPAPAFGTTSFGSTSAFGSPAFGAPAFGTPSFGATTTAPASPTHVFGSGSTAATGGGFAAFAKAGTTGFGSFANTNNTTSSTSAFGQQQQQQSAFGQTGGSTADMWSIRK